MFAYQHIIEHFFTFLCFIHFSMPGNLGIAILQLICTVILFFLLISKLKCFFFTSIGFCPLFIQGWLNKYKFLTKIKLEFSTCHLYLLVCREYIKKLSLNLKCPFLNRTRCVVFYLDEGFENCIVLEYILSAFILYCKS